MIGKKITMFSGIQPTGNFHLGNYFGAVKPYTNFKDTCRSFFCIADLHSLTRTPSNLQANIVSLAKTLIALGLTEDSTLFVQSDVSEHTELYYMLSCITYTGELNRMTQYKDKSKSVTDNAGLFSYPVLMAADILLYDTGVVPVGIDQTQHLELARHLAVRFNKKYGETFTIPEAYSTYLGKVHSLQYPDRKMSKSDDDPNGVIYFSDTKDEIARKVNKATTDTETEVKSLNQSAGISNLLELYGEFKCMPSENVFRHFEGKKYKVLKEELTEEIDALIHPIRNEVSKISDSDALLMLRNGAAIASIRAKENMQVIKHQVYNKV